MASVWFILRFYHCLDFGQNERVLGQKTGQRKELDIVLLPTPRWRGVPGDIVSRSTPRQRGGLRGWIDYTMSKTTPQPRKRLTRSEDRESIHTVSFSTMADLLNNSVL